LLFLLYSCEDALKKVIAKCVAGAKVQELCDFGDKLLTEETGKVFKKEKDMKKGCYVTQCIQFIRFINDLWYACTFKM